MNTENKTSGRRKFLNGDGGMRLRFIAEFMNRTGNTTTTIANLMGYKSRQTVFHWLDKDDMKMSKCYELFDACGYRITFSMTAKSDVKIECMADVVMMTEDRPLPGDRRLSFMARAIAKSGMTQEAVAKALGMRRTAIQHWLNEVDDCLVSQVYETAEVLGMKVKISIEPKQ
jgi:DNA-binding XRE family transcriptional regulator